MRIYTHHGRTITVPDFSDLPVDDAKKIIQERHLRYEVFDSLYIAEKEKGTVIDQQPKPGVPVKKNRIIYFTINASSPEKTSMPDLVGITLREARAKIISTGLKLGNLEYRFDLAKNVVLEQQVKGMNLEKGDTILKGTAIDLVLGKGLSKELSVVPNLLGLTVEQAQEKASDAFFSIGAIISDINSDNIDTLQLHIFRQRPVSNNHILVPLGTPINLWITTDSAKLSETSDPDNNDNMWQQNNQSSDDQDIEDDSYNNDYN
jgi:beta-lactam-binding protein with PASTA domain